MLPNMYSIAVIKVMSEVTLIEKRLSQELTDLLGLEETLDRLAKTNEVRRYRHVL